MNTKRIKKSNKGFTMLESIIAISILLVAILSVSGLVLSSIQGLRSTKNKVVAAYLAQEGIELVRNIRDSNWIEGLPYFDNNLSAGITGYCVDYDDTALTSSASCDYTLYLANPPGPTADIYSHDATNNEPTIFERRINILSMPNPEDDPNVDPDPVVLRVQSIVSWSGPDSGSIIVEDRLYDWR